MPLTQTNYSWVHTHIYTPFRFDAFAPFLFFFTCVHSSLYFIVKSNYPDRMQGSERTVLKYIPRKGQTKNTSYSHTSRKYTWNHVHLHKHMHYFYLITAVCLQWRLLSVIGSFPGSDLSLQVRSISWHTHTHFKRQRIDICQFHQGWFQSERVLSVHPYFSPIMSIRNWPTAWSLEGSSCLSHDVCVFG